MGLCDWEGMDNASRIALIRAKARKLPEPGNPKPAGLFAAANPDQKTKRKRAATLPVYPTHSVIGSMVCESGGAKERGTKWLEMFDAKPATTLRHKRGYRAQPLTKIAQQLPAKLPRLTFCPKTRRRL